MVLIIFMTTILKLMQVHIFLPTKGLILFSFFFFFIPANMSFYCKVLCCKVLPQPIISVIWCYMWFWSSGRWWERKRRTWCPSWNNWHKNKSRGTGNKVSCLFFCLVFNPLEASEKKSEWTYQHTRKLSQFPIK